MAELKFTDYILDNIHGYIALTDMESEIEGLPVFRRLKRIKQLGLANWIFPGAEHTRYSHSLGVMHIADKMAIRLSFSQSERQLVRIAGMLHDIGHFPISHVGERAYMNVYNKENKNSYENSQKWLESLKVEDETTPRFLTHTLMHKNKNSFHHESMGEMVIRNSEPIIEILERFNVNIDDICSIITGDINDDRLIKYVQLLHSEMDADRMDYLLRDSLCSGTAYGSFEINTLIKNLEIMKDSEFGIDIVGVNSKGIASSDQFLTNRYFAYSQVFYNKNVKIVNYMAEKIVAWFLENEVGNFPTGEMLVKWIENQDASDNFFQFTDNFFIEKIRMFQLDTCSQCPDDIRFMIAKLNNYESPDILEPINENNIIVSGHYNRNLYNEILKSRYNMEPKGNFIEKIDRLYITEHVKKEDFIRVYNENKKNWGLNEPLDIFLKNRLINGVAHIDKDNKEIKLLTDEVSSLTKDLCRYKALFFRRYCLEGLDGKIDN